MLSSIRRHRLAHEADGVSGYGTAGHSTAFFGDSVGHVTRSKTRVFKAPHGTASTGDEAIVAVEVSKATRAAPACFPSMPVSGEQLADAGLDIDVATAELRLSYFPKRYRMASCAQPGCSYRRQDRGFNLFQLQFDENARRAAGKRALAQQQHGTTTRWIEAKMEFMRSNGFAPYSTGNS